MAGFKWSIYQLVLFFIWFAVCIIVRAFPQDYEYLCKNLKFEKKESSEITWKNTVQYHSSFLFKILITYFQNYFSDDKQDTYEAILNLGYISYLNLKENLD